MPPQSKPQSEPQTVITTFTVEDLQACKPTGHVRDRGRLLQVSHPIYGRRWVRKSEWAEASPKRPQKYDHLPRRRA